MVCNDFVASTPYRSRSNTTNARHNAGIPLPLFTMSGTEPRIIILDDEDELRALLQRFLSSQGFNVRAVSTAAQLDRLLAREAFDALVLDLMMPDEDGLSICRRLRAAGETIPILMLTARGDPVDRIIGLEMGADDYLPKPFEPRELSARLMALLRRQAMTRSGTAPSHAGLLRFGPYRLNLDTRQLWREDEEVELSSAEFNLLRVLATNPGRTLGRERLLELAWGRDHGNSERSIDVQVVRLRRLIEADPAMPRYIRTVWGAGYVFVREEPQA